jgi:hypothetical protein
VGKGSKTHLGFCGLCGAHGELCLSHLIPRRVYEIILKSDLNQTAPIMMTDRITVAMNSQLKDYLLCGACEDRFSERERYATGQMSTPEGFKLLERLRVAPPMGFQVDRATAFAGEEIGVDMDKLAYFGLSVFWRAGAHVWPSKMTLKTTYSIDLLEYQEPIRNFLLGSYYPRDLSLSITVAEDKLSQGYAYFPAVSTGIPILGFGFLACGIMFQLGLAKPVPHPYDHMDCVTAPRRPIFLRNMHDNTMHAASRLMKLSRKARNVA